MRHLVPTSIGQIHVRESGPSDGEAIVLLHETPTDSTAFDRVVPRLAETHRVLALDTPGHGGSDPMPPGDVTAEGYARVVGEALDGLGLESIFLVGVHTGALFAIHLTAGSWAGRVRRLVLSGVPVYSEEERRAKLTNRRRAPEPSADGSHLTELWDRISTIADPLDHRTRLVCQILLFAEPYRAYEAVFGADPRPVMERLDIPTLLLNVEADRLTAADQEVARLIGRTTIKRLEGGTPAYRTAAPAYAAAIQDFLVFAEL